MLGSAQDLTAAPVIPPGSMDQRDCVEGKKSLGSPFQPLIFPSLLHLSSALLYSTLASLGLTTAQIEG